MDAGAGDRAGISNVQWDDLVLVGHIARTHGTRGQVIVNPETDFPEQRFRPGQVLYIRRGTDIAALTIDAARFHHARPVLALRDVTDMNAAEVLSGAELRIPEEQLTELPDGTFYRHDLVGCRVTSTDSTEVGRVVRVDGPLDASLLVVDGFRGEVLVPMVSRICVRIDTAAREIVIDPPEGLLEANEPTDDRR